MSTLKVTDIQSNGTGFNDVVSFKNASGTENGKLCKAYIFFDGASTAALPIEYTNSSGIYSSFNISSVTESSINGYGYYQLNFTNPMPDKYYAVAGVCGGSAWGSSPKIVEYGNTGSTYGQRTTSNYKFAIGPYNGNWTESDSISIIIF